MAIVGCSARPQICIRDFTNEDKTQNIMQVDGMDSLYGLTVAKTGNSMVAFSAGINNCVFISFAMPEHTTNETPFSIVVPSLKIADSSLMQIRNLIIGTTDSIELTMQLCNDGESTAELTSASFVNGEHFRFAENNIFPIILKPDECTTFTIIVCPLDTGLLRDILRFKGCSTNYDFTFSVRGINRKLTLLANPIDFGEVCLYNFDTLRIPLFRNDDSVDVLINSII
jgi:hypothetical protein